MINLGIDNSNYVKNANRGETLKIAERVPFRLTHNMVDAMGVSGYSGGYQRACCHTMRVLRANREALLLKSALASHLFRCHPNRMCSHIECLLIYRRS
jgi:hypothetical protein